MTRQEQLEELEKEWMSQDKILAYPNWLTDQLLKARTQKSALMEAIEPFANWMKENAIQPTKAPTELQWENLARVYEQVKEKI